jgi:hypothetical protein
MATYAELFDLKSNTAFKNKIAVACIVAAEAIRNELTSVANHANRLVWAASVFKTPEVESERMLWAVLAANKSATTAQITGATDATIQTAVDNAVNVFAVG